jgi:hypothetical protein
MQSSLRRCAPVAVVAVRTKVLPVLASDELLEALRL